MFLFPFVGRFLFLFVGRFVLGRFLFLLMVGLFLILPGVFMLVLLHVSVGGLSQLLWSYLFVSICVIFLFLMELGNSVHV